MIDAMSSNPFCKPNNQATIFERQQKQQQQQDEETNETSNTNKPPHEIMIADNERLQIMAGGKAGGGAPASDTSCQRHLSLGGASRTATVAPILNGDEQDSAYNKSAARTTMQPVAARNGSSQVSSHNENSSDDHSTSWPGQRSIPSKRSAQKRLEAAHKLNLILPQQQQQQLQIQQQSQRNCLSTPIVITSDDLQLAPSNNHNSNQHHLQQQQQQQQQQAAYGHLYQSASQQILFDSLAHQLGNQGGEVSLFTGLPSCTPASADRLAASGINPFFLHAATTAASNGSSAVTAATANGGHIAHNVADDGAGRPVGWPEQSGCPQQQQTLIQQDQNSTGKQGALASQFATSSCGNSMATAANNNNNITTTAAGNQQNIDQRTKLTIADLQAASALSPIILSPLSFLGLSPEQDALLRYGYVSPNQHPLAGRTFTQADLNQFNHHNHQQQVYHLNQMYQQSQRADLINAHHHHHHHYSLEQAHQQMSQHQSHFNSQEQQRLFEAQQQKRLTQTAEDLTQQQQASSQQPATNTTTATAASTTAATATGQVYIANNGTQLQLGAACDQQLEQQRQPASSNPQRHFVAVGQGPLVYHGAIVSQQQVPRQQQEGDARAVSQMADKCAQRLVEPYPASDAREQLARQQLVIAQEQPVAQQPGLLLMPADQHRLRGGTVSGSPSLVAAGGDHLSVGAQTERPAIILYEPSSSPSLNRTTNYNHRAVRSGDPKFKHSIPKQQAITRAPMVVDSGAATIEAARDRPLDQNSNSKNNSTTATAKLGSLSSSPLGNLATDEGTTDIARANSSDNLVSDRQTKFAGLNNNDNNNDNDDNNNNNDNDSAGAQKAKVKQKKLANGKSKSNQDRSVIVANGAGLHANGTTQDVPVKKKSRGGRRKKLVTHEEMIARKNRSKERNRVAARRCRQKRKQFLDELRDQIDQLHELNQNLQAENLMLKSELEAMKRAQA